MPDKLPRVYANKIGNASNNRKIYYSKLDSVNQNTNINTYDKKNDILEKYNLKETVKQNEIRNRITELFKSPKNVYKIKVKIKMDGKSVVKSLIGRTNSKLITLDDELIDINKIENIEEIDN